MTDSNNPQPLLQGLNKADYNIKDLDDEIRVDRMASDLLRHLYQHLCEAQNMEAEQAGSCCRGADYFLREFIIAERCENIFSVESVRIRQFAGHWYITRTPEPNMIELKEILNGTAEFYRFMSRQGLVDDKIVGEIAKECAELDYFQQRIEDFWTIEDGGFDAWRKACPL